MLEAFGEAFNLFNKTNILGVSTTNYSGFFNSLVPDRTILLHLLCIRKAGEHGRRYLRLRRPAGLFNWEEN